jgi:hypothetical protein
MAGGSRGLVAFGHKTSVGCSRAGLNHCLNIVGNDGEAVRVFSKRDFVDDVSR